MAILSPGNQLKNDRKRDGASNECGSNTIRTLSIKGFQAKKICKI